MSGISFFILLLLNPQVSFSQNSACECPQLKCDDACEDQQNLTFYTEKCESGTGLRSCAKPTCVAKTPAPPECLQKAAKVEPKVEDSKAKKIRQPAAEKTDFIATVRRTEGEAWLVREKSTPLSNGSNLRITDIVKTGANGRVEFQFVDGNEVHLSPQSELRLAEYNLEQGEKKRALLNLIKGKVRNKVNQKYTGGTSAYEVRTRSAVAGVRGTDFVVSYDILNEEKTTVTTLNGEVNLNGRSQEKDEKPVAIAKGQRSSWIVEHPHPLSASDKEWESVKEKVGKSTPVQDLPEADIVAVRKANSFKDATERTVSSQDRMICRQPQGRLNDCQWSCENNPAGSKQCRTDLPEVQCVRRRCNANGSWSEPTRLPASQHEECSPKQPVIKACDY